MKHEDFNERYNEVMFDERDVIEKFLKDQYDLRYGHQRDCWHFEPAVSLLGRHGLCLNVTDIKLDSNLFVTFAVNDPIEGHVNMECFDFAYGELSKVIDALPDADEVNKQNAETDLRALLKLHEPIGVSIENAPYRFTDKFGNKYEVLSVAKDGDKILYEIHETLADGRDAGMGLWENLNGKYVIGLRDHININVLHRSYEYNRLVKLLAEQPDLRFEPASWGDVEFTIHGTDMKVDVLSASLDANMKLMLCVDDDNKEAIYLKEKDIRPEYLVDLVSYIEDNSYSDIMDTYNGHNPELVRKINAAWKKKVYHDRFVDILFAIGCRDKEEILEKFDVIIDCDETAMDNAHEIMEGVCDDCDLETILGFIRYK